jgi:hypothetical protein
MLLPDLSGLQGLVLPYDLAGLHRLVLPFLLLDMFGVQATMLL